MLDQLKIAIVCDWLTVFAGAERVVYELHKLFPKAPIYTTLYSPKNCPGFENAVVHESFIRYIPFARKFHRVMLPWMPLSFEKWDLSEYDLVISSSHSAAKGVITQPETLHVSYCHSPMRYVWDKSHDYQKGYTNFSLLKPFYRPILHNIRMWDRIAAERVDHFLCNSSYVAGRIKKYYKREAEVIHPPVNLEHFKVGHAKEDYYFAIGRLIPYKRFDLVVDAFTELGKPLKIVGEGPELKRLKRRAGKNVEFLGPVSDDELKHHYQKAKALIFPQVEDFGIVPLEAMASGTPVIAFAQGGALETVVEGESGMFFREQTVESLRHAVHSFEQKTWDPHHVAEQVKSFGTPRFKTEILHSLEKAWKGHQAMLG